MNAYRAFRRGMRRSLWSDVGHVVVLVMAAICCLTTGCGKSRVPQERVIQLRRADPAGQVRSYLEGYAQGQPVGSEQEIFPQVIADVRQADPDLAGVVETGFAEIQANPGQAGRIAKKLLERLGPARNP